LRLEALQRGVERWGAGDLSARVNADGRDEVAFLAERFNHAAERIETLMESHKSLLANASHELRSPLARIRMGIEMLKGEARPELRAELERDIAELDAQIDEILLASRLEAVPDMKPKQPVDLLALAAEECARAEAVLEGEPVTLGGDERLLRRMLRNLLENGRRYGAGSAVEVSLRVNEGRSAQLDVCDRGPGVPAPERERIFEPFYRPAGSREREGSVGLGLALARSIARRHGGDVRCLAREGGGSCFRVELPV
jgi:signal transduction histidine kinase